MAKPGRWFALGFAASVIGCTAPASDEADGRATGGGTAGSTDISQVRQAIARIDSQWAAAVNRGDAAAAAGLYADDGRFMVPNAEVAEGRANIQKTIQGFVDARARNVVLTPGHVDASGDLAYEVGQYSLEVQPPGAPQPISDKGKYVLVLRRQSDGTWKIVADIFNTNQPAPSARP